jgi:hypothetical protein
MAFLSALLLLASVCAAAPAPPAAHSTLVLAVDPRMELLGVVQQLARARLDPAFKPDPDVERVFGRFRGHPAVRDYAKTYRRIGNQESFGLIATFLTPPPELAWARDPRGLSGEFFARLGGRSAAEPFLADLRDFARVSDFAAYYAGRREDYARYEREARTELGDYDYLGAIDRYVGRSVASRMTVFICVAYDVPSLSYMTPYPYRSPHRRNEGPYEIFTSLRPTAGGAAPRFDLEDAFASGLFNEYFYAFTDYIRVDYEDRLRAFAPLFPSFGGACFSNWLHCSGHLIVSALSDRLSQGLRREREAREGPLGAARRWTSGLFFKKPRPEKREPTRIEIYDERLSRRLEEYEARRDRYATLADFYPRLIDAFEPPPPAAAAR